VFSSNLVRLGAVVMIVAAVVAAFLLGGGASSNTQTTLTARGSPLASGSQAAPRFNLSLPPSWSAVPASRLAAYPGHPVAVLLRKNRTGLIVITSSRSNPKLGLAALGPSLAKNIAARFPDAKTVSAKLVTVRAGTAFYYSFVRTKAGTVNGVLVVPAGKVTYQLNSVTPGDQPQAAKEVGQIFLSFRLS
jgi:phage tail protein X